MRTATALAALSLLGSVYASDVLDLTKDTFHSTVGPESLMLVEFFAPWCGHCKALAPHYEEAATILKNQSIKLAKVDCTAETELCSAHGVNGYPTLKVFRNGEPAEYGGNRKTDGIVSYMKKQALPAVSEVTAANNEEFSKADRVVIVAYLSADDAANRQIFDEFAEQHRDDFLFGAASDPAALSAAGVVAPVVVLYKTFDEGRNDFAGPFTAEGLLDFVADHSMPLLDEISPENFANYAEAGIPLAYIFVEATDPKREELVKSLEPVARKHKGEINFVWIDALKFADHAKSLNLPEPKWPSFAIQNVQEMLKYPLEQSKKVDFHTVSAFVDKFAAGGIKPSVKSQPVPKLNNEGVYVLVADEFDKVIADTKKDLLVEFYAPWCGHCKKLAPTWETLGDRYAGEKSKLVIAKMDATENDIPPSAGFKVQGFPTIKFKPAGSSAWIDYEGDRSIESFIEFIDANATNGPKIDTPVTDGAEHVIFGGADESRSRDEL